MKTAMNKAWFLSQFAARKTSQRQLAFKMGMEPSALSLIVNGKRKLSAVEAGDLAKHLGTTLEDVMRHAGASVPNHTGRDVPIVGTATDKLEVRMTRPHGPQNVAAPAGCQNCRAIRVQAEGFFMDGWLLFYRPTDEVSPEALGNLCIVQPVDDNRFYVRHVTRGYEAGWFNLNPLGSGPTEHARLKSAAPICWSKQQR
jgi:hypothetical protein